MDSFTAERIERLEDELERAEQDRDKWKARAERLEELLRSMKVEFTEYEELVRKGKL